VASASKLQLCLRVLMLAPFFIFFSAKALTPKEVQSQFNVGISLMEEEPEKAAQVFRDLYEQSSTIRIQLELARSLYLAGRLEEAKDEFINILKWPNPITVRDKV